MKKIIFDTDIGGDCDDAGALAIIHEAENLGIAKLLCVVVDIDRFDAAGCTDVINRYYGHVVPIGQVRYMPESDRDKGAKNSYGRILYRNYEHSYKDIPTPPAVPILRRALAENDDSTGKVTFIVTGCCANVADLLKSGPDDISPLTGMELVAQHVEEMAIMAGNYDEPEIECNVSDSIDGARYVFDNCPVPIAVEHATEGMKVMTGKVLFEKGLDNPVGRAYYICMHGGKRCSWDPLTALYAIYGCEDIYRMTAPGKVTIDENGISTFKECEGGKHRLLYCKSYPAAEKRIDQAMIGVLPKK